MSKWRDVKGWEGLYQVSDLGEIRSVARIVKRSNGTVQHFKGRLMAVGPNTEGYLVLRLSNSSMGRRQMARAHRLVADAFLANPDNLNEINHIDGNKTNNCASNLEWCTTKQNALHSIKNGLNKIAKLTADDAEAARHSYNAGRSCRSLAREYGIDKNNMRALLRGQTYTWALPAYPQDESK